MLPLGPSDLDALSKCATNMVYRVRTGIRSLATVSRRVGPASLARVCSAPGQVRVQDGCWDAFREGLTVASMALLAGACRAGGPGVDMGLDPVLGGGDVHRHRSCASDVSLRPRRQISVDVDAIAMIDELDLVVCVHKVMAAGLADRAFIG